jgi:2'-5' RNA ligase
MSKRTPEEREAWTHRTAVVFIPPSEVWPTIQEIRRLRDRQFQRWMPHLTLLYPFAPRSELPRHLPALTEACAALEPFEARLATFHSFQHGGSSSTLWLAPEPKEAFVRLQSALEDAAPAFGSTSRFKGGFTPHLSVGQAGNEADTPEALDELASNWTPLTFRVSEVQVIAREKDLPFEVVKVLPLGSD